MYNNLCDIWKQNPMLVFQGGCHKLLIISTCLNKSNWSVPNFLHVQKGQTGAMKKHMADLRASVLKLN